MCQSSIISQILELINLTVMIFIFDCVTVQTENRGTPLYKVYIYIGMCRPKGYGF